MLMSCAPARINAVLSICVLFAIALPIKDRHHRPQTLRIVRPTPRETQLLRKIAQGLAVRLDLFKLGSIQRIVRHDKIICCSNAPIAFGAYARRDVFDCRRVRPLIRNVFWMRFGVGMDCDPFFCILSCVRNVVWHTVLCDNIRIVNGSVDDLSVIHVHILLSNPNRHKNSTRSLYIRSACQFCDNPVSISGYYNPPSPSVRQVRVDIGYVNIRNIQAKIRCTNRKFRWFTQMCGVTVLWKAPHVQWARLILCVNPTHFSKTINIDVCG
nr:MAG TPA: hypothetical protein [Caudoviricetes sp.]